MEKDKYYIFVEFIFKSILSDRSSSPTILRLNNIYQELLNFVLTKLKNNTLV